MRHIKKLFTILNGNNRLLFHKLSKSKLFNILINVVIVTIFYFAATKLPITNIINNVFVDFLQGYTTPRNEIVVVAIDDKSLQEIGPWPWNREIFANLINKLNDYNTSVIGIDVLFIEPRIGDDQLKLAIDNSSSKIVFGSKVVDSDIFESIYKSNQIDHSYINIVTDSDGKLRRIIPFNYIADKCVESFPLSLFKNYLKITEPTNCNTNTINYRGTSIVLPENLQLQFKYTNNDFLQISAVDILNGKVDPKLFKDKIALLGSTTIDLRTNLNDNFIDVKGNTIPGILVHANILNTFLENNFINTFDQVYIYLFTLIISSIFLYFYLSRRSDVIYSISYFVLNLLVLITGVFLYEYNYELPVITLMLTFTFCYIYSIIYRNISEQIEKRFVKQVFAQYVNPTLLEKIVNKPESLKLGGESKEMTIMFSDIRGFTSLSETMSAEELVHILNIYLDKMGTVIDKYNGTIDKFIGDAIMAFWNAPLDDKNHRQNGILTALDMVEALKEFNLENNTNFNIGIGLNTGHVIVGNLGSSRRFDYTVIGDDVNLASRTEGLTKKYGINILLIESTVKGNDYDKFLIRLIDEVIVKGKSTSVKLYQPLYKTKENEELIKTYQKAFKYYQKQDFVNAKKYFLRLSNDEPSKLMLHRIDNIPDLKSMHGVWKWDEK